MKLSFVLPVSLLGAFLRLAGCKCKSDTEGGYSVPAATSAPNISGTWRWNVNIT